MKTFLQVHAVLNTLFLVNHSHSHSLLKRVEGRLESVLATSPQMDEVSILARDVSAHLSLKSSARRFRPQLVETLGLMLNASSEACVSIATATEMIHASSLLHDDVVDDSSTRRGKPTANKVWSNAVAVLSGDWLLTEAFAQLKSLPVEITHQALSTVGQMSTSALYEVKARGKVLSFEHWKRMAEGKTGALFAFCADSVALAAGLQEVRPAFSKMGFHLGLAFQLADDLKDFTDLESGKPLYADIRNQNPSAVISLACEKNAVLKTHIQHSWESMELQDVTSLAKSIQATGAIDDVASLLSQATAAALDAIARFDSHSLLSQLFQRLYPQKEGRP